MIKNHTIGGYLELEVRNGNHLHAGAIRLNSGTNAFEYILRTRNYRKVYIPYYTCEAMLVPLQKLNIEYKFYYINDQLEPTALPQLEKNEGFLYTNYFGLKTQCVEKLSKYYGKHLIADHTQAFFSPPCADVDTFYSARKFFGLPDGAYLFTDSPLTMLLEQDCSYQRCSHLLKRIDLGASEGYPDFNANTQDLANTPLRRMSNLTEALLGNIDYDTVRAQRIDNYRTLDKALKTSNFLQFATTPNDVPLVYPYLSDSPNLKHKLIEERIFVATYWPNVLQWVSADTCEYMLAQNTCFLPIDQRYDASDMEKIINIISSHHE